MAHAGAPPFVRVGASSCSPRMSPTWGRHRAKVLLARLGLRDEDMQFLCRAVDALR